MLADVTSFLQDHHAASPTRASYETRTCVALQPDRVELLKFVAKREARLARTWHQIASNSMCAGQRAG
jgi:hypothetical protein